ncbi:hypothetical protein ABHF33_07255 [Chitinibacter sp. FCG-7]|uniref:Cd(II)/Pb(II)-responsive transcriptional regulator n=1 Tax=Chitinibacter mangrovi TaxID=3153927 RepID=A0AAU7FE75_9NEIS
MEHLKQQLADLRRQCQTEQTVDSCGILQGLADMNIEAKPDKKHTHLG